jgi:hypothetical protein
MTREITRTLLSTSREVNSKSYRLIHIRVRHRMFSSCFVYKYITFFQNCPEHYCLLQNQADRQVAVRNLEEDTRFDRDDLRNDGQP